MSGRRPQPAVNAVVATLVISIGLVGVSAAAAPRLPDGGLGGGEPSAPSRPAGAPPDCALWAATDGSDSNPGTEDQPLRSAAALTALLDPGQTGCFRAGIYQFDELSLRESRITLSSAPGESATLRGRIRVERSATGAAVENLVLDGRNPNDYLGPLIYADRAKLLNNEITNDHTAICVHVGSYYSAPAPVGVRIKNNQIHECGRLPRTNHDHGIYLGESQRTTVRGNWIYDNADRGVQMYPHARKTVIKRNVIDANGQGVIFGGDGSLASSRNSVRRNVIANSDERFNVESSWEGPTGAHNSASDNCLWSPSAGYYGGSPPHSGVQRPRVGFSLAGSTIAAPQFVDRSGGDLRLVAGSKCARVLGWTDAGASNAGSAPPAN